MPLSIITDLANIYVEDRLYKLAYLLILGSRGLILTSIDVLADTRVISVKELVKVMSL